MWVSDKESHFLSESKSHLDNIEEKPFTYGAFLAETRSNQVLEVVFSGALCDHDQIAAAVADVLCRRNAVLRVAASTAHRCGVYRQEAALYADYAGVLIVAR